MSATRRTTLTLTAALLAASAAFTQPAQAFWPLIFGTGARMAAGSAARAAIGTAARTVAVTTARRAALGAATAGVTVGALAATAAKAEDSTQALPSASETEVKDRYCVFQRRNSRVIYILPSGSGMDRCLDGREPVSDVVDLNEVLK